LPFIVCTARICFVYLYTLCSKKLGQQTHGDNFLKS